MSAILDDNSFKPSRKLDGDTGMPDKFITLIDFSLWSISFFLGMCGGTVRVSARIRNGKPLFFSISAAVVEMFSFGVCGLLGMFAANAGGYTSSDAIGLAALVGGYAGISAFKVVENCVLSKLNLPSKD